MEAGYGLGAGHHRRCAREPLSLIEGRDSILEVSRRSGEWIRASLAESQRPLYQSAGEYFIEQSEPFFMRDDLLTEKSRILTAKLAALESVLVAYSGGVDSAFLAWAARNALGDKMLAVLAESPSLAEFQKQ